MNIPYHDIDNVKFSKWLKQHGAEILPPTNTYEALRFKGNATGVIYDSGKVNSPYTLNAIHCYKKALPWDGKPLKTKRKTSYKKQIPKLLERDGQNCYFCTHPLVDDITVEHLEPLSMGGKNKLSNMVLMHEKCNAHLGNLPLNEKIDIIIRKRIKLKK